MTHSRMIRAWFFCVGFVRSTQGSKVIVSKREIGHVSDLLVDERTWSIRYLVVDTSNWWIGRLLDDSACFSGAADIDWRVA